MKHHALQSYQYHVWANNQLFAHLKQLPEEVYHAEVISVFPSVSAVMEHIYVSDIIWLGVASEKGFEQIKQEAETAKGEVRGVSAEELEQRYNEITERYHRFFAETADLDGPLTLSHPTYGKAEASYSAAISHVVNHATYHRGNVSAMLRQQGQTGVPTDYVAFLYTL